MPWVFVAKLGTSTTQLRNIFLSKLGRQCMYYLNDFEILIFQLTKHIVVRCVAFKIAKLSNIDIWNGIQYSRSISPAKLLWTRKGYDFKWIWCIDGINISDGRLFRAYSFSNLKTVKTGISRPLFKTGMQPSPLNTPPPQKKKKNKQTKNKQKTNKQTTTKKTPKKTHTKTHVSSQGKQYLLF